MGQHWRTLRALLRLTHPLPTLLNAVAAAALATVAGAPPSVAALVALTMLGVHTFIGATNDYIDRDRDAGRPEKPLARGQLPPRAALLMAVTGLTAGLTAAAQVSTLTLVLAALGALVGFTYNVWLKRTALSWLPFAVGVSIIPAFAWSTVSSVLPAPILTLSLVALPGGAALALQNSLADRVIDAERGMRSAAVRLGEARALRHVVRFGPAELQRHRMFRGVVIEMASDIAMLERAGGHHLGIEQRAPGDQAKEEPVMPVRPVHHRCDGNPVRWI